MKTLVYRRWWK